MPPSLLLDSRQVDLNNVQCRTVARYYDNKLVGQTKIKAITYLSDGLKIKGYMARPAEEGKYPVLIWNRGGWHERGGLDDLTACLILASTARWGYVVLATQYRQNFGGEGTEDWGGDDVNDAFNLIELSKELPECDSSRIGVEGVSRGGITTYRLLCMHQHFRCAIVHAGISDLEVLVKEDESFAGFIERRFGHLSEDQRQSEIEIRSGIRCAKKFSAKAPILLMHGTNDKTVPYSQSELMAKRLKALGHAHEFVRIEGGGHVALKDGSYREIDRHRKAWLKKYL